MDIENLILEDLNGKEIWSKLYNKELNTKKNVLEYIDLLKVLKSKNITEAQYQQVYNFVYSSIEKMKETVKPNTIMFLKNALKAQIGKYVQEKEPSKANQFIEFFKKAYPPKLRRKDFTWVLMDLTKITEEQIWQTLTFINAWCLRGNVLTKGEKEDVIDQVKVLIGKRNIGYVNKVKSLEHLLRTLNIKIVSTKEGFKVWVK